METLFYLTIAIFVILILAYIFMYNSLIGKKNTVENAFSSVDVYLKQRHDLIPNLVAAVKEYMKHERQLLEKITEIRASIFSNPLSDEQRLKLEGELSALLGRLMISVENYPQLKASENFLHLQSTLNEVEEKIAAARRFYNSAVTDFNNALEMFPTNIVARKMKLTKKAWFAVPEEQKLSPSVQELFKQ